MAIVDAPFDVDEFTTPFGKRWGNECFTLSAEYLAALNSGKTVALDLQSEYVAFVCKKWLLIASESQQTGNGGGGYVGLHTRLY